MHLELSTHLLVIWIECALWVKSPLFGKFSSKECAKLKIGIECAPKSFWKMKCAYCNDVDRVIQILIGILQEICSMSAYLEKRVILNWCKLLGPKLKNKCMLLAFLYQHFLLDKHLTILLHIYFWWYFISPNLTHQGVNNQSVEIRENYLVSHTLLCL